MNVPIDPEVYNQNALVSCMLQAEEAMIRKVFNSLFMEFSEAAYSRIQKIPVANEPPDYYLGFDSLIFGRMHFVGLADNANNLQLTFVIDFLPFTIPKKLHTFKQ